MKKIEVVAGIIVGEHGKILCVQRPESSKSYISKKWEFPGGKVEPGEDWASALERELREELSIEIKDITYSLTVEHTYLDFHLTMHAHTCVLTGNDPVLHEHIDIKWLEIKELHKLDWAAADVPIVEWLQNVATHS